MCGNGEAICSNGEAIAFLDYSVSSGPFLRFTMSFEFLSEMFDNSVCETRDPSLTTVFAIYSHLNNLYNAMLVLFNYNN